MMIAICRKVEYISEILKKFTNYVLNYGNYVLCVGIITINILNTGSTISFSNI